LNKKSEDNDMMVIEMEKMRKLFPENYVRSENASKNI
jgi:hypothetical protein